MERRDLSGILFALFRRNRWEDIPRWQRLFVDVVVIVGICVGLPLMWTGQMGAEGGVVWVSFVWLLVGGAFAYDLWKVIAHAPPSDPDD